jgi:inner membrane protein
LATGIAGLYGFLWVALASEDHALLFGSIGVFLALAGLMWATRRIEWSTVG